MVAVTGPGFLAVTPERRAEIVREHGERIEITLEGIILDVPVTSGGVPVLSTLGYPALVAALEADTSPYFLDWAISRHGFECGPNGIESELTGYDFPGRFLRYYCQFSHLLGPLRDARSFSRRPHPPSKSELALRRS